LTLTAGRRLGTYEIVAPLGAGGMGEVYRDQIRGKLTGLPGVEVIARQLDALQEDDQDAAGDREGALRQLPADGGNPRFQKLVASAK